MVFLPDVTANGRRRLAMTVAGFFGTSRTSAVNTVEKHVRERPIPGLFDDQDPLITEIVGVACLIPAWRAAAVEATEALRCE